MSESPQPAAVPPVPTWEETNLSEGQRSFNRFCENWLFAFLVAMSVRHFALEAFRIPTSSMEPTLYGEASWTRSDFVLVDKLWFRVSSMKRWDITVFQFPHPEIEVGGHEQPAVDADGKRLNNPITQPLMYRNFVKRALVLPGERFYLANGDLFISEKDSSDFHIARKPQAIQDRVWQRIYRHGGQQQPSWYVPWSAVGGGTVDNLQDKGLRFVTVAADHGDVTFTQPLRNLYFKAGQQQLVEPMLNSEGTQLIEVAMDAPLFTYKGRTGNIWNLDEWWVNRVTSGDQDDPSRGALLNSAMRERISDLRISATITALEGAPVLRLSEGQRHHIELRLTVDAMTLVDVVTGQNETQLARVVGSPIGKTVILCNLDDQVILTVDGTEVHRSEIPPCDPEHDPLAVSWVGAGSVTCGALAMDRDIHYCSNGFTLPESLMINVKAIKDIGTKETLKNARANLQSNDPAQVREGAKTERHIRDTRAQMLGIPFDQLTPRQEYQRLGFSPQTAITAPDNAFLMMGDNSPMSWDGRNWGFVPAANLRGRVILRSRARFIAGFPVPFGDWSIVR